MPTVYETGLFIFIFYFTQNFKIMPTAVMRPLTDTNRLTG